MLNYYKKLAQKYDVSIETILSIALNRYGINMKGYDDSRIRFNLEILNNGANDFFAVCVNTYLESPFELKDNNLYLKGVQVGKVSNIERDTCTATYFRNDKKVITLNSNSRSKCKGCKFCGTYSLSSEEPTLDNKVSVIEYFNKLLLKNGISEIDRIENVTVCTGCFPTEEDTVNHLLMLNEALKEIGFSGSINYIGSQLRSKEQIQKLSSKIDDFGIYLTIEKFLDREKFMRPEKASLSIEDAKRLLEYCSSLGITTTFLYILGLEDIGTIKKYFEFLMPSINKFPIVQIYQNYTPSQEKYRHPDAKGVEYYLKSRQIIDQIFKDSELKPKMWENFRGLYYEKSMSRARFKNEK